MKVILKEGFTYIPKWNGNRKAKKEDQIDVYFKFMSADNMSDNIGEDGKYDADKEWLFICSKVNNLETEEGIVSALDIKSKATFLDLFLELKAAYKAESVVNKKK